MTRYQAIPNNPHVVSLSHTAGDDDDLDYVMSVLETGTDEEINALAAARQKKTLSKTAPLSRPLPVKTGPHDSDPVVAKARCARLGSPNFKPERLTALTKLGTEPQAMPSEFASVTELEKFLSEVDPAFAKLDVTSKDQRVKQLRDALKAYLPTVAAARAAALDKPVLLLSAYPGRNRIERAIWLMRATDPKFGSTSWEAQCRAAREVVDFFDDRVL